MQCLHKHYQDGARDVLCKAARKLPRKTITELVNVYKGSGSYDLNKLLYMNRELPPLMASLHEVLQLLMNINMQDVKPLRAPPVIYRVLCGKYGKQINTLKQHDHFHTRAYTSWSFDAQRALDFAQNGCVLLYARLPADLPSFYIDGCKHSGLYQHEIVITPDIQFTVERNEGPLRFDPSALRGANTFYAHNEITIGVMHVKIALNNRKMSKHVRM